MPTYDVIIVLGSRPDTTTWQFPSHVFESLDRAAGLLQKGDAPFIALSGKWALAFDALGIVQPFLECDAMADYLISKGVPPKQILKERQSKDTVSNLYYLKKSVLQPRHMYRTLVITADFRLERITYLVQKIFGPAYAVDFQTVPHLPGESYPHEPETLIRTQRFLEPMKPGDDSFLDGKFYTDPFYR